MAAVTVHSAFGVQEKKLCHCFHFLLFYLPCTGMANGVSLMVQWVKNLPAIQEAQETYGLSLGLEHPLGKEMATHSSILTLEIPWTEETGGLQFMRLLKGWI